VPSADFVLDAWAAVLLLTDEGPVAERLRTLTHDRTIMDWVSVAEVLAASEREQGSDLAEQASTLLRARLALIVEIDPSLAQLAAQVRARYDVGLANAFAIATAVHYDAVLVSANAEVLLEAGEWRIEDLRPYLAGQKGAKPATGPAPAPTRQPSDPRLQGRLRTRSATERVQGGYGRH